MKKKNKILFSIIVFSFLISAASVFILKIEQGVNEDATSILLGAMFWTGTILGFIFKFILVELNKKKGNILITGKSGLLKFFQSKPGKVNDIFLIISTIIIIISIFIEINNWVIILALFFFILSLELHFVINGKCYSYFKSVE